MPLSGVVCVCVCLLPHKVKSLSSFPVCHFCVSFGNQTGKKERASLCICWVKINVGIEGLQGWKEGVRCLIGIGGNSQCLGLEAVGAMCVNKCKRFFLKIFFWTNPKLTWS